MMRLLVCFVVVLSLLVPSSGMPAAEPMDRRDDSGSLGISPDLSSWLRLAFADDRSQLPIGRRTLDAHDPRPMAELFRPIEATELQPRASYVAPSGSIIQAAFDEELDLVAPLPAPAANPDSNSPSLPNQETPRAAGQPEDNAGTDDASAGPTGEAEPNGTAARSIPSAETARELELVPLRPADETPRVARNPDDAPSRPEPPSTNAELTPEMTALRDKLRKCLDTYYKHPVTNGDHSPWGIMHVLIAFGCDSEIYAADHRVSTAGWLCWNGSCRGMRLFAKSDVEPYFTVRQGAGYQGHPAQLLAILAQSRVAADYEIRVEGKKYTIADLIEYEKKTCREKTELTFKLIGLSHYLPADATWKDDRGVEWSIQKLIKEELAQPVIGAACGGTHRLTGLAYAVRNRERSGGEISGQWLKARKYLNDYHAYTFKLQNPDGSFSTNWFEGRQDYGTIDRRFQTTGHILEWLVYSLPAEDLDDPRVIKAVSYLTDLMQANANHKWEVGPRGHAIHALNIYDRRRFGGKMGERSVLARQANPKGGAAAQARPQTSGSLVRSQIPATTLVPPSTSIPGVGETFLPAQDIPSTAERPEGSIRLRR